MEKKKLRGSEWKLELIQKLPLDEPVGAAKLTEIIYSVDESLGFERLKTPIPTLNLLAQQVGEQYLKISKSGKVRWMVYTITAPKGLDELGFKILEYEEEHSLHPKKEGVKKTEPKSEEPKEKKINFKALKASFRFFKMFLSKSKVSAQEQERSRGKAVAFADAQRYRDVAEKISKKAIIMSITPNTDRRKKDIEISNARAVLLDIVEYVKANYPKKIKEFALPVQEQEKKEVQPTVTVQKPIYVNRVFGELEYLIAVCVKNGDTDLRIIKNRINNTSWFNYQISVSDLEYCIKKFPDIFKLQNNMTVSLISWELVQYNPKDHVKEIIWHTGLSIEEIKEIIPDAEVVNKTVKEIVRVNVDSTCHSLLRLSMLHAKMRKTDFIISGIDDEILSRIYKNHIQRALGMISTRQAQKYESARFKYEHDGSCILTNDRIFFSIEEEFD